MPFHPLPICWSHIHCFILGTLVMIDSLCRDWHIVHECKCYSVFCLIAKLEASEYVCRFKHFDIWQCKYWKENSDRACITLRKLPLSLIVRQARREKNPREKNVRARSWGRAYLARPSFSRGYFSRLARRTPSEKGTTRSLSMHWPSSFWSLLYKILVLLLQVS